MYRARTRLATTAAVTAVLVGIAGSATAVDDANVTVTGGSLAGTAATADDFTAVALDGTAQTTTGVLSAFSVTDATGTGAGWNVSIQGTQFKEHDGLAYVASGKMLDTDSLSLSAPTVSAIGTTSTAPVITAGPYVIDGVTAVKIASAATDTGMGTYDFSSSTMTVSIPASAYAKTYRSDVTVSVVSAP